MTTNLPLMRPADLPAPIAAAHIGRAWPAEGEEAATLAATIYYAERHAYDENERAGWARTATRRSHHIRCRDAALERAKLARNKLKILQAEARAAHSERA